MRTVADIRKGHAPRELGVGEIADPLRRGNTRFFEFLCVVDHASLVRGRPDGVLGFRERRQRLYVRHAIEIHAVDELALH